MNDSFGETVSPVAAIRAILHDYPFSASILRELLQNSDDARATKQIFVLDVGDDPALIAYNDSQFQEEDWKAIQSIHESSKKADTSKIGKYGVGFRACYHVTDRPQIFSGSWFALLDPLRSGGKKIGYDEFKESDDSKHFDFFSDIFQPSSFPGTIIRLPLRSSRSELSQRTVLVLQLHQMLRDYITEEMNVSLLFLDNLRTIEIWEARGANKTRLATWTKSEKTLERQSEESQLSIYDSVLSDGETKFSWRIVQTQNAEEEAKSRLSAQVGGETVNHVFKKHKLRPDMRIAYPLFSDEYTYGRLFTFLPLPSKTNFPVHIHAPFALTSSRQSLRNRNETGIVAGSDNHVLIKWNSLLFDYYIPQAWSRLLKTLAEDAVCKDIFRAWPPYCSSITSGDGLYWQNILQATFSFAVQSGLAIWPKVSETDKTIYVGLKSSLVVARGQVDLDVLVALAQLGLTLVQLPQTHMEFLDESITKLTPRVARDLLELRGLASAGFNALSQIQRGILRAYFLSDQDFSSIYGLPLFPILNGSYICLEDRRRTTQRYIALAADEVDIFGASAGDAISLDLLQPQVAALVRDKGTTQANINLLYPPSVIDYLSSEPTPRSEEDLSKFWSWLSEWRHKKQAMVLFKSNDSLRLIPTSKGLQLVSSPIFRALGDRLFEKLGLAFISPLLSTAVVQFLSNYKVVRDIDDMNDFLAAVDLNGLQPFSNDESKSVFDHISLCYRSLSDDNMTKLKKLPVFPVLVPSTTAQSPTVGNTSVEWRDINGLTVKGISPMSLIPLTDEIKFLDRSSFSNPASSLLKALKIFVLKDKDILLLALGQFSSQPKSLQASFVSYIRGNHRWTNSVISVLGKTRFIRVANGTLQSPVEVIDPNSGLKGLFPTDSSGLLIPMMEDDHDLQMLDDLRSLQMMKKSLSFDMVQERVSYISSNCASADALSIAHSLLSLMNEPNFVCFGFSIDPSINWLPTTRVGLVSSKECIDSGRLDTDLFDEVLAPLDETITISPSFRALLGWDKPLPLSVLTRQLDRVLKPNSDAQYRKVRGIIRELAGRQLRDADIKAIKEGIAERPWVPTESGILTSPSRAVFVTVPGSSCFHKIGFSQAENQIAQFLLNMGCLERPSASAIISELGALCEKEGMGISGIQQAVQLLEILPDSITDQERASLLVPIDTGDLVPLHSGVFYYRGGININDGKTIVAHHLITEKLAEKIGMKHLGLDEAESDIDLGGKPITIIRNTLRQYDPKQIFTEFIANASDAGAKRFNILLDNHEGPRERLLSEGLAVFQSASLVVHNDGIFSRDDFIGILQTGIGGKAGKPNVIGRFGLGALSMFHFTELAMIVSGGHVLFMSPSKRNLSFCGKHSLLLPLQSVKRLYADHLEPLNGLFGFNLSSTGPYQGTLFRLPLRNEFHSNQDSAWTTHWSLEPAQQMLLAEFDKLAYKSLLFTGLGCINIYKRQRGDIEALRVIESTRKIHDFTPNDSYTSETVTFKSTNVHLPKWLVVTMAVNIPDNFKGELAKKCNTHHLLPMRIAAVLDSSQVQKHEYNLFCTLPLPVTMPLPAHISAPLILEQERRNVRIDSDRIGIESEYNQWLLSSQIPLLFLCLLEKLLHIQDNNVQWWPEENKGSDNNVNVSSRIFLDRFWGDEIIKRSSRRIFISKYNPTTFLSPKDAVLFSKNAREYLGCGPVLSKVLSVVQPPSIVELPRQLFEHTKKAMLRCIDGEFLKTLLGGFHEFSWLDMDEIRFLLVYLLDTEVSLAGLSLIPLEDGSYAKIQTQHIKANYAVGPSHLAAYTLFPANRLVNRSFRVPNDLLKQNVNVLSLSDSAMVELVEERIKPGQALFGNEADQAWITSFWEAKLNIPPSMIAHLPLIPTLQPRNFISMTSIDNSSVTVVDAESSAENFDYGILQKIGMTVVLKRYALLPAEGRWKKGKGKGKSPTFKKFLEYMEDNLSEGLTAISRLELSDHEELARWVKLKFSSTPPGLADVASKLPVWRVQQRSKPACLGALKDAIILPASMPSDLLLPFTNYAVIDWQFEMRSVCKEPCSANRITQLLRVSSGTILRSQVEQAGYKRFVRNFLALQRVPGYSLLVPNEGRILMPVQSLFERHELFLVAFRGSPECLLSNDFQDIAESLEKYGLNRKRRLSLGMFIECAKAFDQDDDDDDEDENNENNSRRSRAVVLYRYFNGLSLQYQRDFHRCNELDQLKFIPSDTTGRVGYDGINLTRYMRRHVLSPSKIVLHEYEAICWSQRGRVDPQPNPALCGTYESLGKPTGKEVVKHLKVLVDIGRNHGRCSALLSDLKATYRWLNDHIEDISVDITNENFNNIFLNVDNPVSDEWVWHSASSLVKDLQDVGELHDVKGFLRHYDDLLKAAGVRTIQKVTAKPIAAVDRTSLYRQQFCSLRERGFEVSVTFKAKDDEHEILPAHKAWLLMNSVHFWELFITAGLGEAQVHGSGNIVQVDVPDYSSLCVKETIDWIYVGELPESITGPSNGDEESKAKLDLTLEMLSLAHFWVVTGLHERLQEFIINAPDFINPYWVKDISEHAKPAEAEELLRACKEFEEKNQDIMDGVPWNVDGL